MGKGKGWGWWFLTTLNRIASWFVGVVMPLCLFYALFSFTTLKVCDLGF